MKKLLSASALSLFIACSAVADTSEYYENALRAYNQEKYEEAYIHLKNSLQDDPNNLAAKILMGRMLLRNGYLLDAEIELREALQLGADMNLVLEPLGNALLLQRKYDDILELESGNRLSPTSEFDLLMFTANAQFRKENFDNARRDYRAALAIFPTNIRALNSLVTLELSLQRFADAEAIINQAMALDDTSARLWHLRGRLYRAQNKIELAQQSLEQATLLDPDDPLILRSLADVYVNTRNLSQAKSMIDKILEQTPDDPMAMLLNSWLLAQSAANDEASRELARVSETLATLDADAMAREPMLLYISALSAFAQNNLEIARQNLEQYVNFRPDNVNASVMLARTYKNMGKTKLALEALERHTRNIEENLDGALLLAELFLQENKAFKALELKSRLDKRYPAEARLVLLDVKILSARGKYEDAIALIDSYPDAHKNVNFVLTKSMLLMQVGQVELANKVADQLLELAPDNINFMNFKAAVLIRMRQWQEAEPFVAQVLEMSPTHYSARFNLASIRNATGQYRQANALLLDLQEQQPDNVSTLLLLSSTQLRLGELELAETNLTRVLELDVDNVRASQLLASLYTRISEFDRAIRQYNMLIKNDQERPEYLLQKARLYVRKNDLEQANRQFRLIRASAADDPEVLRQLSKIQIEAVDVAAALTTIRDAVKLAPMDLATGIDYIALLAASKDFDTALQHLNSLRETHKDNPRFMVAEGDVALLHSEKGQAIEHYIRALNSSPGYPMALAKLYQITHKDTASTVFPEVVGKMVEARPNDHFQRNLLADYHLSKGQQDQAMNHYQVLAQSESFPNRAFVLNNMANIMLKTNLGQAEQYIQQAMALNSSSAAVIDTHGWIKALRGQYQEALEVLRRAYAMDSNDPGIQYHLAYTLHKLGRSNEAKIELTQALASQNDFLERAEAEALLDSI